MRLIDAPIGIFRFDGELVLKTEYKSENRQSGKYIPDCYIVRTGEYFWGGAKTANELNNLDVEPVDFAELLPTVTDTISRKAVTDAIEKCHKKCCREDATGDEWIHYETTLNEVESIPPVPKNDADCISRRAAITALSNEIVKRRLLDEMYDGCIDEFQTEEILKKLPPAQPKTGKWALQSDDYHEYYECDQCGMAVGLDDVRNFCPNCGADMREVTE